MIRRTTGQRPHSARIGMLVVAGALALGLLAACSTGTSSGTDGTGTASYPTPGVTTETLGTITHRTTVLTTPSTRTVSQRPSTIVVTPTVPTLVAPPPTTSEPPGKPSDCPYLTKLQVEKDNGQHAGVTTVIPTKPYPICEFTRSDGRFLAATRIVVADTEAAAIAAVNAHVPIAESFPVSEPDGWSGGAMATPDGLERYPQARSIYGVSKGTIAIIAISNQAQSIKGRQMVTDIVANLEL